MKRALALLAVAFFLLTGNSQAQTNIPPSGLTDFGNTVLGYFTSFNTNYDVTFKNNRFDLWTGASAIQGGVNPLVNDIAGSYDLWRPTQANTNSGTFTALSVEALARNSGVAGSIVSGQGGLGFSVIVHDTKATVYLDGGSYAEGRGALFGEVGVRVKKAIGTHFFMGVGIGVQFRPAGPTDQKHPQVLSALAGATF